MFILVIVLFVYYLYWYWSCCEQQYKLRAARIPGGKHEGPFRHLDSMGGLVATSYNGILTIDQVFEAAVQKHLRKPCLGTRKLLTEELYVQNDGKSTERGTYGKYHWESFQEVFERILAVGKGLTVLGMKPKMKFGIYLETRAEWFIACQACFRNNFTVVSVSSTLDCPGITRIMQELEVTHVLTCSRLLKDRLLHCMDNLPAIQHIIVVDANLHGLDSGPVSNSSTYYTLSTFTEVELLGKPDNPASKSVSRHPPTKDDLAVILYTSGAQGDPKGVLVTHSSLVAGMSGILSRLPPIRFSDVYIAYLPLDHISELIGEHVMLCAGIRVGYSSPLTVLSISTGIKPGTKGDVNELKPTLMVCVPDSMERIRKAVKQQVDGFSQFQIFLFHLAFHFKLHYLENGQHTPLLNEWVFKQTRQIIGGSVRALLCGGSALNERTHAFMSVCMCCPVVQVYGLTETCGAVAITEMNSDFTFGRIGPPLSCCQLKLVEWEESDQHYAPTENPPRGEIHVGGPNIPPGYFNNPEQTAEDFYVDDSGMRWFKTGDVGQMDIDGCLRIIDRKKDLVKLRTGEYISLGNIEAKLKTTHFIDNIWIYANRHYCIAFILPNEIAIRTSVHVDETEPANILYRRQAVIQLLINAILDAAAKTGMQHYEVPQKVFVESNPWLPEDGLVTASYKLKRKALESYYRLIIDRMYPRVAIRE